MKYEPTLADVFAYNKSPLMAQVVGTKFARALQARTRTARRFVFDTEASIRVARIVKEIPE